MTTMTMIMTVMMTMTIMIKAAQTKMKKSRQ